MKSLRKLLGLTLVLSCGALSADDEVVIEDNSSPETGLISFTGVVFRDSNGNGAQDEGEPVTEGASVSLLHSETRLAIATAKTDEKGVYVFEKVPPGKYPLEVTFPSGRSLVTEEYDVAELNGGAFLAVAIPEEKDGPKFADASLVNPANTPQFVVTSGDSTSGTTSTRSTNVTKSTTVQTIIPPSQVISPSAP
ncbi:MAG: hypothetical protein CMO55_25375 [Verrucomicrobiales bacterium]|nr:hypothetical protein [Verrucomicrobiales bacterium]